MTDRKAVVRRGMDAAAGLATLLLAVAVIRETLLIYQDGTQSGLPAYSRSVIAAHFSRIEWIVWLWAGAALAALIGHLFRPLKARGVPVRSKPLPVRPIKGMPVLRIILMALALLMLAAGVQNGGLNDVLVKAINICTECIGLG